jgi:hypothetical protein
LLLIQKNKKAATVSRGGFLIAEGSSARLLIVMRFCPSQVWQ